MGLRSGAGLSTEPDPRRAATEAARAAARQLDGDPADVVVVFASGAHLATPELTLAGVHAELAPATLVGCGAGGVLGTGHEVEVGTAIAVWAASLDGGSAGGPAGGSAGEPAGGRATPFHATVIEQDGTGMIRGMPELDGVGGLILLADPFTFPTDLALDSLAHEAPGVPVLGGLASGRSMAGNGALFLGDELLAGGAVGVGLRGVEMLPCVSQGAVPLGRELTVTAAEGSVIHELAGRPAVQAIEDVIGELAPAQRALIASGPLIGVVIESGRPEYEQGDFLVRGIVGVDRVTGSLSVGATVEVGQIIRLHARDAASADADLRRALELRTAAAGSDRVAGALVFSCNGRGREMFGAGDHDATMVDEVLGGVPAAGFFAAGEIGPVGGRSFLHGFTATIAVFPG